MKRLIIILTLIVTSLEVSANCNQIASTFSSVDQDLGFHAVDFSTCTDEELKHIESWFTTNLQTYQEYTRRSFKALHAYEFDLHQGATDPATKRALKLSKNKLSDKMRNHIFVMTNRKTALALVRNEILSRKIDKK